TTMMSETLEQRLARRVRDLRRTLGLTLKTASERAGIHWRLWQKVEAAQAHVTLRMGEQLSRGLGVDGGALLGAWGPQRVALSAACSWRAWQRARCSGRDPSLSERSERLGRGVPRFARNGGGQPF